MTAVLPDTLDPGWATALAPVADEQLTTTGRVDVGSLLRQALQRLGRS